MTPEIIALQTQHTLALRWEMAGRLVIKYAAFTSSHHFSLILDGITIEKAEYRTSVIGEWSTLNIVNHVAAKTPSEFLIFRSLLPRLAKDMGIFTVQSTEMYQNVFQMRVIPADESKFNRHCTSLGYVRDFRDYPPRKDVSLVIDLDHLLRS
jgi:hypothetical protein